ncbi:uncharacterized protein C7orf50 homolog [Mugil cephalus]|uniref:uncharacterized protein C7orf50 homolog n=1 Tax=Mugil cephalus TaxID=48193 RepID=UPI001FB832CF|nr:uncharacterized protein C7orf50 homolog [Mugil cephalus]
MLKITVVFSGVPSTNHRKTETVTCPITVQLSSTSSGFSSHACLLSRVPHVFLAVSRKSYLMAKDKSAKSDPTPLKRKKQSSNDSEVPAAEILTKVKKKQKRMEIEEAPVQIATNSGGKKQKKDKKLKKKHVTEERQTKQTEIPDPPSSSEEMRVLEGEEDLSPEERRVLERKMKKILKKEEKKRLKEGAASQQTEVSGGTAAQQALDYLTCWAENNSAWKFQKTRQTWLLQHMFDSEKIPDEKFLVLLQYLEGLQGRAKDTTVEKAISLVEESGQAPEDTAVQQRAHRAREVIQLLS